MRVLDLGVARDLEAGPERLTVTGTLVDTPRYIAPEQVRGAAARADARREPWLRTLSSEL